MYSVFSVVDLFLLCVLGVLCGASFRKLAGLDVWVLLSGYGEPILENAGVRIQALAVV